MSGESRKYYRIPFEIEGERGEFYLDVNGFGDILDIRCNLPHVKCGEREGFPIERGKSEDYIEWIRNALR